MPRQSDDAALLRNVISDLDGTVDQVAVSNVKDNTLFAIIYLTGEGERVVIGSFM